MNDGVGVVWLPQGYTNSKRGFGNIMQEMVVVPRTDTAQGG